MIRKGMCGLVGVVLLATAFGCSTQRYEQTASAMVPVSKLGDIGLGNAAAMAVNDESLVRVERTCSASSSAFFRATEAETLAGEISCDPTKPSKFGASGLKARGDSEFAAAVTSAAVTSGIKAVKPGP